ncbi:MAG TPA: FBP domain-containing protein [Verrucomicrobiae bacterium]|nr:FBP domain-containing protein [Verrucomicrobiae bacterium]
MKQLTPHDFTLVLERAAIRPRLRRTVKFVAATGSMTTQDWHNRELLAIADRSGNSGVLLIEIENRLYALAYELSPGIKDKTGRTKPVICDFCRTWQAGGNAARITFEKATSVYHSVTFLCCADLDCSLHIRDLTSAAKTSRAQLREDMTLDQRIQRLKNRLHEVVTDLTAAEIELSAQC